MPRVGQNPIKWLKDDQKRQRITVTTVVHIPVLEDYWAQGLDVLKLCLRSLLENTGHAFDLMVLDNGSCEEVRHYLLELQRAGDIAYLIFSRCNLRKLGAMNLLLASAPGEIISFTDSDVYFRPGWLDATLEIMEAFPRAGMVSALPTADKAKDYIDRTLDGIEKDPTVEIETGSDLIPERYIDAHAISLGQTPQQYKTSRLTERCDIRISRNGVSAYVSAQDFQFTTRRDIARAMLPLVVTRPEEYYDGVYSPLFEKRVNEAGHWRLSTVGYYAHHLGNTSPKPGELDWVFDGKELSDALTQAPPTQDHASRSHRLLQNRYVRKMLKRINTMTYSMLYGKK